MGPKGKPDAKGKKPGQVEPEINPDDVATELQKEFYEFTLADIEKKLNRIDAREEELKTETVALEERIEEFKKEKGAIIDEHEQILAMKEEEKVRKREEMIYLSEEIKIRIEKHKKHIEELEKKFEKMVKELTEELEILVEESRILEEFKQNGDVYAENLKQLEKQMEEEEMQHQRNLFEIEKKLETVKKSVKKELQSRLLNLSIEFRQTSQKKIGKPCHRISQENKAIQNVLVQMQEEIIEYKEKSEKSRAKMLLCKSRKNKKLLEKDKVMAKTVIQINIIKNLLKDRYVLWEKLKNFEVVDAQNRHLVKKYKFLTQEVEQKVEAIEIVKQEIEEKREETNMMRETIKYLKKSFRKLQVLIRNAYKLGEETLAVRLIPIGGMEEERYMTTDAKIRLFKKRRDTVYQKKGKILQYLHEFLSKAQMSEDDKKLLKPSIDTIGLGVVNFSVIYGKTTAAEKELEAKISEMETEVEKGPMFYTSLSSLPRSESALISGPKRERESESFEGEFEEYGEGFEEEVEEEGKAKVEKEEMQEETEVGENVQKDENEEEKKSGDLN